MFSKSLSWCLHFVIKVAHRSSFKGDCREVRAKAHEVRNIRTSVLFRNIHGIDADEFMEEHLYYTMQLLSFKYAVTMNEPILTSA